MAKRTQESRQNFNFEQDSDSGTLLHQTYISRVQEYKITGIEDNCLQKPTTSEKHAGKSEVTEEVLCVAKQPSDSIDIFDLQASKGCLLKELDTVKANISTLSTSEADRIQSSTGPLVERNKEKPIDESQNIPVDHSTVNREYIDDESDLIDLKIPLVEDHCPTHSSVNGSTPEADQENIFCSEKLVNQTVDVFNICSGGQTESSADSSPCGLPSEIQHLITIDSLHRPDSLCLPRPLQFYEKMRLAKRESESSLSEYSRSSSTDALIEAASSTPLSTQGTITVDGNLISFVAEGLQEMIKMSSPVPSSRNDSSGAGSLSGTHSVSSSSASGWSTSASSISGYSYSGLSRSPSILTQSPEDVPPIDPRAIMELEVTALKVADSLDHMMTTLKNNLHKMSIMTYGCVDTYKDCIDNTCDSVDGSIKSMYALMAKCEELSTSIKSIYQLCHQIQEIKRLLELFEAQVSKDDNSQL